MDPSPSPDSDLGNEDADRLLDAAIRAIRQGLAGRSPLLEPLSDLPERLHRRVGSFVTLHVGHELNGCIGNVEGIEPLGHAVPRLAWSAAFGDPRLPALRSSELGRLEIELSLLSPLSALVADSYAELIDRIEPGTDGVVVTAGRRQGLFLPSVWVQLPEPDRFVAQLFRKAGLAAGSWPAGTQVHHFTTSTYRRGPDRTRPDGTAIRASR